MIFTIDWEDWFMGILPYKEWGNFNSNRFCEMSELLSDLLWEYKIIAIWYCSGYGVCSNPFALDNIINRNHIIGSHGWYHGRTEQENDESDLKTREIIKQRYSIEVKHYRSPYWYSTPPPGFTGGFYFRVLPYPIFKKLLQPNSIFWIHPWELDPDQPRIKLPLKAQRHYWGLKGVERKLERLLSETKGEWDVPT